MSKEEWERVQETPEINAHFRIEEVVGTGGFSTVYKAMCVDERLKDQYVALKVVKTTCRASRVEREIECLDRVKGNDMVAQLLACIKPGDMPIFVMKYFSHIALSSMMVLELPVLEIEKIMFELFQAIAYVHSKNIVHRDIKPSNFLYSERGCCLVDFGLAQFIGVDVGICRTADEAVHLEQEQKHSKRHATSGFTSTCGQDSVYVSDKRHQKRFVRAGTRGYRAPEVLLKCTYQSAAIDMFSAGVFGLSLLSARLPFFLASDDLQCLAEYMTVFGSDKITAYATVLKKDLRIRKLKGSEDGHSEEIVPIREMCTRLRPEEPAVAFSEEFVDIIDQCLAIDARDRLTAEAAQLHPYFINRS